MDYKEVEYSLHEHLVTAGEQWQSLGYGEAMLQQVERSKDLLRTRRYTVAVMGEFKRGKSTLINALLGEKILPADATPTTATLNRITYGSAPSAEVEFRDGTVQPIGIGDLTEYVTKHTPAGEARAATVRQVVIRYPSTLCQNHIEIIDTPGLNDDARMTAITLDMLDRVDAVLVPIHARFPFSETECHFVCQLLESERACDILFVVTFLDQLDEEDYVYEDFLQSIAERMRTLVFSELERRNASDATLQKAAETLKCVQICGISGSLALKAFVSNNRRMLSESRFEEFRSVLVQILTAKQLKHAVNATVGTIRAMAAQLPQQEAAWEGDWNTRLAAAQNAEAAARAYRSDALRRLDRILAENDGAICECIGALHSEKNILTRAFIGALSGITTATAEPPEDILHRCAQDCLADVNNRRGGTLPEEIAASFRNAEKAFLAWRTPTLAPLAGEGGEQPPGPGGLDMMAAVKSRLCDVRFTWAVHPVPEVPNLLACDVIEFVLPAVERSVNEYVQAWFDAVAWVRSDWFALIRGELSGFEQAEKEQAVLVERLQRESELHRIRFEQATVRMNELADRATMLARALI